MSELDEQIQKILQDFMYDATPVNLNYLRGEHDATQAIKALIANQVREAKIKELEDFRNNWHTMIRQEVHQDLNDRIAELKGDDK